MWNYKDQLWYDTLHAFLKIRPSCKRLILLLKVYMKWLQITSSLMHFIILSNKRLTLSFHQHIRETKEKGNLQANWYHKCDSYFKHFGRENPLDIIYESHHMEDNKNLQQKFNSKKTLQWKFKIKKTLCERDKSPNSNANIYNSKR